MAGEALIMSFIPIVQTTERLGFYSHNKKEPVIYEAVYQSNKEKPIKYIVRTIKNNYSKRFTTEKQATLYLRKLLKKMER